jgi:hypothetical protein
VAIDSGVVCGDSVAVATGVAGGMALAGEARLAGDDSLRPRCCGGEPTEKSRSERGERGITRGGGVNFCA